MGQYRLTINSGGKKAGQVVDLDANDSLVVGGFAVPASGGRKTAPVAAPEPVVEEATVEEAAEEVAEEDGEKFSSRRRRSSSDE